MVLVEIAKASQNSQVLLTSDNNTDRKCKAILCERVANALGRSTESQALGGRSKEGVRPKV